MITSLRMNLNFLAGSAEEEISANRWRQIAQMQQKAIDESQSNAAHTTSSTNTGGVDPNLRNYSSDNAPNKTKGHQPSKSSDFHKSSPALNTNDIKVAKESHEPLRSSLDSDVGAEGRARAYSLSDRLITPSGSKGSLAPPAPTVMPSVMPPQQPNHEFSAVTKKKSNKTSHIDAFLESINQGVFQPFYYEQMVRNIAYQKYEKFCLLL